MESSNRHLGSWKPMIFEPFHPHLTHPNLETKSHTNNASAIALTDHKARKPITTRTDSSQKVSSLYRQSTRKPTHTLQPQPKSNVSDRRKRRRNDLDQDNEDEPIAGNSSLTHAEQPQAKSGGSSRKRRHRHSDAFDHDDRDEPPPRNAHNGLPCQQTQKSCTTN